MLTSSAILAKTTELLTDNGYGVVASRSDSGEARGARVFEDHYGIVAVHCFETWQRLRDEWHLAQGDLVDLMSSHLRRAEPKAWEGYLVLLTPSPLPLSDRIVLNALRSDTNRVRKLVATGTDLNTLDDVRVALLPLLPLSIDVGVSSQAGLLDLLPDLLSESAIPRAVTNAVIDAFSANESVLERLHALQAAP